MKINFKLGMLFQIFLLSGIPNISFGLKQCPSTKVDFLEKCKEYDKDKYGTEAFLNPKPCEAAYRAYVLNCASAKTCDDALTKTLGTNPCGFKEDKEGYTDVPAAVSCAAGVGAADAECRKLNPKN